MITLEEDFDKRLELLINDFIAKELQPILITEILDMHNNSLKKTIKNVLDRISLNKLEEEKE